MDRQNGRRHEGAQDCDDAVEVFGDSQTPEMQAGVLYIVGTPITEEMQVPGGAAQTDEPSTGEP